MTNTTFQAFLESCAEEAVALSALGMEEAVKASLSQVRAVATSQSDQEANGSYFEGPHVPCAENLQTPADFQRIGGPFGAVIFCPQNMEIIGRGRNRVMLLNDASSHAEIEAIRDAYKQGNGEKLNGAVIVSSCYPCPMCYERIVQEGLTVYYLNTQEDAAAINFSDKDFWDLYGTPVSNWPNVADSTQRPQRNQSFGKSHGKRLQSFDSAENLQAALPEPTVSVIFSNHEFEFTESKIETTAEDPVVLALRGLGERLNHFHHKHLEVHMTHFPRPYALWALKWAQIGKIILPKGYSYLPTRTMAMTQIPKSTSVSKKALGVFKEWQRNAASY